jgi:subtilisin family serine protease
VSGEPGWILPEDVRDALRAGTGRGVRVAILDSGVDATHPALASLTVRESWGVVVTEDGTKLVPDRAGDAFGHGTAVAHVIHEVAPEAEIGSFKVLDVGEGGGSGTAAALEAAVTEAIARGYHLVNCSFGTPARPVVFRHFKQWIDAAYLRDVHVVTACNNADYARPEWPAHFPSVIAVNMGRIEGDAFHFRPGHLVEFFARGEKVRVPWLRHEWKTVTGSSYAAPRVAGLVARLLSVHPGLSAPLVKAALRHVARPWTPEIAGDNVWS